MFIKMYVKVKAVSKYYDDSSLSLFIYGVLCFHHKLYS